MKLYQLFEQDFKPLTPGEKRPEPGLSIRDIDKIHAKLYQIDNHLHHSEVLKNTYLKDANLINALEGLMKRLEMKKDYLERMKSRPTSSTVRMLDILRRECSDFLETAQETNMFLYRGVRSEESVYQGRSREDRSPKDSQNDVSEVFDAYLKELGFRALRKNSIFTTTSRGFAGNYGWTVYLIFPKNGFSFLSTINRDLILDSMGMLADYDQLSEFTKKLRTWLEANVKNWDNTHLGSSVAYENYTGMFRALNELFTDTNDINLPQEFNKSYDDFISAESVRENFEPNQTDLAKAMKSRSEVLISGEYWALKANDWEEILKDNLLDGSDIESSKDIF